MLKSEPCWLVDHSFFYLQSGTEEVKLVKGEMIKLTLDDKFMDNCDEKTLWLDYKNITKVVQEGSHVYIDDGLVSLKVKEIGKFVTLYLRSFKSGTSFNEHHDHPGADFLNCEIENGGMLGSKKGVNLPGANVDLPAVSEKDIKDLQFGVEQGVDMVFASFIRKAADVDAVRKVLGEKGKNILIISKLENHEGVRKWVNVAEF